MSSFRVKGKILATIPVGGKVLHLNVDPDEGRALLRRIRTPSRRSSGASATDRMGAGDPRQGRRTQVQELLEDAWRRKAPKRLLAAYDATHPPRSRSGRLTACPTSTSPPPTTCSPPPSRCASASTSPGRCRGSCCSSASTSPATPRWAATCERNRWLVIDDPELKAAHRRALPGRRTARTSPPTRPTQADGRQQRVIDSATYLVDHIAEVPGDGHRHAARPPSRRAPRTSRWRATTARWRPGSGASSSPLAPAASARRGRRSTWCTSGQVAELLGIPDTVTQVAPAPGRLLHRRHVPPRAASAGARDHLLQPLEADPRLSADPVPHHYPACRGHRRRHPEARRPRPRAGQPLHPPSRRQRAVDRRQRRRDRPPGHRAAGRRLRRPTGHPQDRPPPRATPRATLLWRAGWAWVAAEGTVELVGPDDPLEGDRPDSSSPAAARACTRAAGGGEHDDWAEYDRVMAAERRMAVLLTPTPHLRQPVAPAAPGSTAGTSARSRSPASVRRCPAPCADRGRRRARRPAGPPPRCRSAGRISSRSPWYASSGAVSPCASSQPGRLGGEGDHAAGPVAHRHPGAHRDGAAEAVPAGDEALGAGPRRQVGGGQQVERAQVDVVGRRQPDPQHADAAPRRRPARRRATGRSRRPARAARPSRRRTRPRPPRRRGRRATGS